MKNKERFSVSMDLELVRQLDREVSAGRYASRSRAIEACVRQVFKLQETDERVTEFLLEFVDLLVKHPELGEELKKVMKKE